MILALVVYGTGLLAGVFVVGMQVRTFRDLRTYDLGDLWVSLLIAGVAQAHLLQLVPYYWPIMERLPRVEFVTRVPAENLGECPARPLGSL